MFSTKQGPARRVLEPALVVVCLTLLGILVAGPSGCAQTSSTTTNVTGPGSPATVSSVSSTSAAGGSTATTFVRPAGLEKIDHFVFIMQENRSFDSYFGTYPGADGLPQGVALADPSGGPSVAPFHDAADVNRGGPHNWVDAIADVNGGKMDGFLAQSFGAKTGQGQTGNTNPNAATGQDPRDVMGFHDNREIPNYWNYAHLYVLQDHLFESVASYSLPAHLYLLAGQSGGYVGKPGQPKPSEYDFAEMTESLKMNDIPWKYYVTSGRIIDSEGGQVAGGLSQQEQHPHVYTLWNPLPAFPAVENDPEQRDREVDTSTFYKDAASGNLPAVSWIIPSGPVSEHPPAGVREGMAYVTGLVNAVMKSPDWDSTAIFIAWDDWGGFYDHVVPPKIDQYGYGLRVPGLVISPYSKQGYVDKKMYSFDSWLRLVEERFGIPPLTERERVVGDMIDAFDFTQSPRAPLVLSATLDGSPYPQPLQQLGP
jgi:phospholipase C